MIMRSRKSEIGIQNSEIKIQNSNFQFLISDFRLQNSVSASHLHSSQFQAFLLQLPDLHIFDDRIGCKYQ